MIRTDGRTDGLVVTKFLVSIGYTIFLSHGAPLIIERMIVMILTLMATDGIMDKL